MELYAEKENAAIDDHTLAAALIYEDSILCAASGGDAAPAWFGTAMQKALEPINKRLNDLEDRVDKRLDTLEGKIDAIGQKSPKKGRKAGKLTRSQVYVRISQAQKLHLKITRFQETTGVF
ncbi:hypothetical protein B0H14DRAFT_2591163 [Mycena olivaceomarginata]|nr:hypothetical protein B0H14DRAFT_2591163 [Mycena olivaceomarginata]